MIKFSEDFCKEVFFESVLKKFIEDTGTRYATAVKDEFTSGKRLDTDSMHEFHDARFNKEKTITILRNKPYFEGKTEKEFRDEFWAEIQKFFNTNVLDKKNKQDITDYLIDYIDRLCLEHVEEVRNEKNVQGAIARLERNPLYRHNKQH